METKEKQQQWNLLKDKSLHVVRKRDGKILKISFEELLVRNEDEEYEVYSSCHSHADLGFAEIQSVVSFLQSACAPSDLAELRERIDAPMDKETFRDIVENYEGFFDLRKTNDEETFPFKRIVDGEEKLETVDKKPYMQNLLFKSPVKKDTGVQKILPGFPDENGAGGGAGCGCLFVERDAIRKMCPACMAAALFNKASCAPSFGGGFKVGLRGAAPLTVLVYHEDLRKMAWLNVIPMDSSLYPDGEENMPTWTHPYEAGEKSKNKTTGDPIVNPGNFGAFRGLFFQPNSIEVIWDEVNSAYICDCCGLEDNSGICAVAFKKQASYFKYSPPYWYAHPHSPFLAKEEKKKKGEKNTGSDETENDGGKSGEIIIYPANAGKMAPAWALLGDLFPVQGVGALAGHINMSSVVKYHLENKRSLLGVGSGGIHLSIGGYANDQSKILARRHEIVSLSAGSTGGVDAARDVVMLALEVKTCVFYAVKAFMESSKKKGMNAGDMVDRRFYAASEAAVLKAMDEAVDAANNQLIPDNKEYMKKLERIGREVLDSLTSAYITSSFEHVAAARKKYSETIFGLKKKKGFVDLPPKKAPKKKKKEENDS